MRYLLDTNVISELRRPRPNRGVLEWLSMTPSDDLFLSAISLLEISKGVSLKALNGADGVLELNAWLYVICRHYGRHLVPVDSTVALSWGRLVALHPGGDPFDLGIAATAASRRLVLVTRNVRDFERYGIATLNPFDDQLSFVF